MREIASFSTNIHAEFLHINAIKKSVRKTDKDPLHFKLESFCGYDLMFLYLTV